MRGKYCMRKHHYFEFMDLKWFPNIFREVMTDTLAIISMAPIFDRVTPLIAEVMDKVGTNEVLDLCSGSGGPWVRLFGLLRKDKNNVKLKFTDLYPNPKCLERFSKEDRKNMSYSEKSVNALDVPKEYRGVRTFFGSFHHMSPENAVRVLKDAADKKVGIIVAESYSHPPKYLWKTWFLQLLVSPFYFLFLWVIMAKTMRGSIFKKIIKILFTYLIPIIPLCMIFDTFISGVRVYMKEDLEEMVKQINAPDYCWKPGTLPKVKGLSAISYIQGYPKTNENQEKVAG